MRVRAPRVCLALAAALLCPAALACAGKATQAAGGSTAATGTCAKTYVLTARPSTIVSSEWHSLFVRALADSCGRQTPVQRAHVHLLSHACRTNSRGRCTLDVRLATGRYRVRLYVNGHRVASTSVSAIPGVAH